MLFHGKYPLKRGSIRDPSVPIILMARRSTNQSLLSFIVLTSYQCLVIQYGKVSGSPHQKVRCSRCDTLPSLVACGSLPRDARMNRHTVNGLYASGTGALMTCRAATRMLIMTIISGSIYCWIRRPTVLSTNVYGRYVAAFELKFPILN